jgi:DNA invertase Pin-like site-specific DNA recombinase
MNAEQTRRLPSSRVSIIPARTRTSRNEENFDGQKKKIGVYVRVSTDSAMQATSYDIQVSYFKEYVEKNPNWELVEIFADEGLSGTSTKNRVEFNRMIERCQNKEIDYIITKSISRFARNTLDCLHYIRMLKNLGIGIYFQKENLDTLDSKSELFLTILSSMAQEESRSISENTKWGVQKRFQQGKAHVPTTYFLGYTEDEDGNIIIDEKQAEVVRRIYREVLEGKGTPTIAKELMRDGIRTARNKKTWTSDSVYKILRNEKYKGDCLAQKTVTVDFLTHERVRNKEHQPQYYIRNHHPAIISEEDWEKVQEELNRRSKMFRDPDNKYNMAYSGAAPFSNKLFCGECGRPVTRRRLTTHCGKDKAPVKFTAWHCRVASKRDPNFKDCKCSYVWEEELERAFMMLLFDIKMDQDKLIEDVGLAIEEASLTEEEDRRLNELGTQIDRITDKITAMATRSTGSNETIYEATMRHLIYEQEILQMEYDGLSENKKESEYLEENLKILIEVLEKIKGPEEDFDPDILIKVIEKGIVYNKWRVEFQLKCGVSYEVDARRRPQRSKKSR